MSILSEEQRHSNTKKLIQQNKKLHHEVLAFEAQINIIFSHQAQFKKAQLQESQSRNSSRQKKQFSSKQQKNQSQGSVQISLSLFDQPTIEKLLESSSSLISTKVIPILKNKVEHLKFLNIKQNAHYLLKEQDDLKIMKKELDKLRKQKQVVTLFIKDKSIKLEKQNNQLINHKNLLRQELLETIKTNRQSASAITELQRAVRRYHLALHEYRGLSTSTMSESSGRSNLGKIETLDEVQIQLKRLNQQIISLEGKWKPQFQALDNEYNKLKEEMQKKRTEEQLVQWDHAFHKTRILVMKDEKAIWQEKQKQKLIKINPNLQKQLQQYLKEEQEKLLKKQNYRRKQKPRDKDEEQFHQIISKSAAKSPNTENTIVQALNDDKNIVKLKNYFKQKQKIDKQIEAKPLAFKKETENLRLQRTWNQTQDQLATAAEKKHLSQLDKKGKTQKGIPRILLTSVKLGTTFYNEAEEQTQ